MNLLKYVFVGGLKHIFSGFETKCGSCSSSRQPNIQPFFSNHHQDMSQVSTHVALDLQTYSALAQHTQITWTAVLKCDEPSRVGRWRLGYITY